jgi:thiamine kinase-like enzyme
MQPREAEHIARLAVPGSGVPRLRLLGSGLLNETYRVDRDGLAFSMRVAAEDSRASRQDRVFELELLETAARLGLAPALVRGDAERGLVVQEWAPGQSWPPEAARRTPNIARMAALLKRVHELQAPQPARIVRPRAWILHYSAQLAAAGISCAPALAAGAAARLAALEALPQAAGVVCHSDLHLLNVLDGPARPSGVSSLMLLDWEYAHVSEPLWDLAGWSANNDFSERLLRELFAAYLGRPPHEHEWTRCGLLAWLYDYVCLLWSELYVNTRRGAAAADIERRSRVLNARLAAGSPAGI